MSDSDSSAEPPPRKAGQQRRQPQAKPEPDTPGSEKEAQSETQAQLISTLQHLTATELRSLLAPIQQRALLARYEGLPDASKISALRRVKEAKEMVVEDLSYKVGSQSLPQGRRPPNAREEKQRNESIQRLEDHRACLDELATELTVVEHRYAHRPRRQPPPPPKPYLSTIFFRELDRARTTAGSSATGASACTGNDQVVQ
eukprot:gnl/TRDRNA2_/TRDRNA2_189664_c0_seq1.p1 gnl/TRDRNA2_/TRDRNA2_189664_c0~~gnl/TRDRNA2_/TRDRNA2_189664_c0_seq1.p1  ORF type:complete len:217 (+),score=30.62 gnl/TRDRNA2_/TRDRNA2_189664_c0_seq1:50-652(+)